MAGSKRRAYSEQFKQDAVLLVRKQGYTQGQAARELGIPGKTFSKWISREHDVVAGCQSTPQQLRQRVAELEHKLRRSELEKAILKKAAAYFASQCL